MFNVSLPKIASELSLTPITASWSLTAYAMVFAISSITYSRLSDFISIRNLMTYALITWFVSSVLGLLSQSFAMLLAARILMASASCAAPALGLILVTRYFPAEQRGRYMSYIFSAIPMGMGIGPVLGGTITQYLGWNYIFAVTLSVALYAFYLISLLPKETMPKGRFDFAGALFVVFGSVGMLLFISFQHGLLLLLGIVGMIAFWYRINHAERPFIEPKLFVNAPFLLVCLMSVASYSTNYASLFLVPLMLDQLFDISPMGIGFILFPGAMLTAVISNRVGKWIDRKGTKLLLIVGHLLLFSSMLLFSYLGTISYVWVIIGFVLLSAGVCCVGSSISNELSKVLSKSELGSGMGLSQLIQYISVAVAVTLSSVALQLQHSLAKSSSFSNIFIGLSVIVVVSAVALYRYHSRKTLSASNVYRG